MNAEERVSGRFDGCGLIGVINIRIALNVLQPYMGF